MTDNINNDAPVATTTGFNSQERCISLTTDASLGLIQDLVSVILDTREDTKKMLDRISKGIEINLGRPQSVYDRIYVNFGAKEIDKICTNLDHLREWMNGRIDVRWWKWHGEVGVAFTPYSIRSNFQLAPHNDTEEEQRYVMEINFKAYSHDSRKGRTASEIVTRVMHDTIREVADRPVPGIHPAQVRVLTFPAHFFNEMHAELDELVEIHNRFTRLLTNSAKVCYKVMPVRPSRNSSVNLIGVVVQTKE